MQMLRQELIESLKTRSELIKYKLLVIAVIGSAGIGLNKEIKGPYFSLLLCFIPFACIYIDALIYHHSLATHLIGAFIKGYRYTTKSDNEVFADYEKWSFKTQNLIKHDKDKRSETSTDKIVVDDSVGDQYITGNTFSWTRLERMVVHWSSIILCSLIALYALFHSVYSYYKCNLDSLDLICDIIIIISSIAGIVALWLTRRIYVETKAELTRQALHYFSSTVEN